MLGIKDNVYLLTLQAVDKGYCMLGIKDAVDKGYSMLGIKLVALGCLEMPGV